jgi:aminoglycoside phosphotransferase (APT) family kinase protein
VRPVIFSGWDNWTFHLGDHMVVRMPSSADYACQVEKEHQWLPQLAPHLSLPIPEPLAIGKPDCGYEHQWSVYRWIEGKMSSRETITDRQKRLLDVFFSIADCQMPCACSIKFHHWDSKR